MSVAQVLTKFGDVSDVALFLSFLGGETGSPFLGPHAWPRLGVGHAVHFAGSVKSGTAHLKAQNRFEK